MLLIFNRASSPLIYILDEFLSLSLNLWILDRLENRHARDLFQHPFIAVPSLEMVEFLPYENYCFSLLF